MNLETNKCSHPNYNWQNMANNTDPERMVSGEPQPEDEGALDRALRPTSLDELIGQNVIRENLRTMITAAKARGDGRHPHGHDWR